MNFNEILRKNVNCENIKITKNQGYTLSPEDAILEKPQGVVKLTPSLFRVKLTSLVNDINLQSFALFTL